MYVCMFYAYVSYDQSITFNDIDPISFQFIL